VSQLVHLPPIDIALEPFGRRFLTRPLTVAGTMWLLHTSRPHDTDAFVQAARADGLHVVDYTSAETTFVGPGETSEEWLERYAREHGEEDVGG
jgi:hypothetical protein